MNLKSVSKLLIAGLSYTFLYKFLFSLFPNFSYNKVIYSLLSFFWILATATIFPFIFYFLKEVKPPGLKIRRFLILVLVFTSIIIILKFPFIISIIPFNSRGIIYSSARILNSLSILLFLISFYKALNKENPLIPSLKLIIPISLAGVLFGLISIFYELLFITDISSGPIFYPLQIIGVIIFILSYVALINFLIRFIEVNNYEKLIEH